MRVGENYHKFRHVALGLSLALVSLHSPDIPSPTRCRLLIRPIYMARRQRTRSQLRLPQDRGLPLHANTVASERYAMTTMSLVSCILTAKSDQMLRIRKLSGWAMPELYPVEWKLRLLPNGILDCFRPCTGIPVCHSLLQSSLALKEFLLL
jgi:hypothetical protein